MISAKIDRTFCQGKSIAEMSTALRINRSIMTIPHLKNADNQFYLQHEDRVYSQDTLNASARAMLPGIEPLKYFKSVS